MHPIKDPPCYDFEYLEKHPARAVQIVAKWIFERMHTNCVQVKNFKIQDVTIGNTVQTAFLQSPAFQETFASSNALGVLPSGLQQWESLVMELKRSLHGLHQSPSNFNRTSSHQAPVGPTAVVVMPPCLAFVRERRRVSSFGTVVVSMSADSSTSTLG